jgi:glycosyltransferase involved in cell wall biosynthesis
MRNTFLIKPNLFWDLARYLMKKYGAPTVKEFLTIYIHGPSYEFKVTISSEEMRWHWYYPSEWDASKLVGADNNRRPWQTLTTTLENLRAKLFFIATYFTSECSLSRVLSYTFRDNETGFTFDLRPKSLVGDIVSLQSPASPSSLGEDGRLAEISKLAEYQAMITDYISDGLASAIQQTSETTHFAVRKGKGGWRLSKDITNFCLQNGIANYSADRASKDEILKRRTNDYSFIEEYFHELTGVDMISDGQHYHGDLMLEKSISIIIPYFNSGASLYKLLSAIDSQSLDHDILRNLEIIIVDDGSSDPAINHVPVHEFSFGSKLTILTLSRNSGAARARQLGMKHSSGDILVFMDSDILLSSTYLADHILRNQIVSNGVFVSFKEDVEDADERISLEAIRCGLPNSNFEESRTNRNGVNLLEETDYFKNFHGSSMMVNRKLSGMVIGHNFSLRRELIEKASPFSSQFRGWGYEDEYHGIQLLLAGAYFIPVLSSSVYHINHSPRSGSEERKRQEEARNKNIIDRVLQEVPEYTWVISPERRLNSSMLHDEGH